MKNKLKITLLASTLLLMGAGTASACVSTGTHVREARAEGETSEVVSSEEITEEEVTQKVEELVTQGKSWLNEKWNTFVAPLIGGVSLSAVIMFIANIILNYRKGKKVEIQYQKALDKLVESNAINGDAKAALIEMKAVAIMLSEDIKSNQGLSDETKKALKDGLASIVAKVDSQSELLEKSAKVEPILRLLVQIVAKIATCDENVAKMGALDDIKELQKLLKEF